jgi:chromosome segregation ATPase
VQGKLAKLQSTSIDAENEKAAMAATLQAALQEKESLRGSIMEKDHNLDLLSMDKIYLSREVESLKDQIRKLESELEQQHEKLKEVKRERTELHTGAVAANERFQAEIFRIKENSNESLELNRRESNAIADEKLRF